MKDAVLVIGGGIAGMRTAVELLQQRFKVCLLEEAPFIGGKTETVDRFFPPGEYAACALQPLILELSSNPSAKILTSAKVLSLRGGPRGFRVDVLMEQAGNIEGPQKIELTVDAVIVETGLDAQAGTSLGELGLALDENTYSRRDSHGDHTCHTCRDGVFICDATKGSQEIGQLVIQACAAPANAAALLSPARGIDFPPSAESELQARRVPDEPKIAVVIEQGDARVSEALESRCTL